MADASKVFFTLFIHLCFKEQLQLDRMRNNWWARNTLKCWTPLIIKSNDALQDALCAEKPSLKCLEEVMYNQRAENHPIKVRSSAMVKIIHKEIIGCIWSWSWSDQLQAMYWKHVSRQSVKKKSLLMIKIYSLSFKPILNIVIWNRVIFR